MRKKVFSMVLVLCVLVGAFTGCAKKNDSSDKKVSTEQAISTEKVANTENSVSASEASTQKGGAKEVNLNGMYTVKDPAGVDYDTRTALYKPVVNTDDTYAEGDRYSFMVIYGKEGKGQYMYAVEIFETADQATAYQKKAGKGTVDGKAVVVTSDATFFQKMESFMPTVDDWVNNSKESGMMPVEEK